MTTFSKPPNVLISSTNDSSKAATAKISSSELEDSFKNLAVSKNFYHPYEPYDIQKDFMKALYDTLENKKLGIFESPTGKLEAKTETYIINGFLLCFS